MPISGEDFRGNHQRQIGDKTIRPTNTLTSNNRKAKKTNIATTNATNIWQANLCCAVVLTISAPLLDVYQLQTVTEAR